MSFNVHKVWKINLGQIILDKFEPINWLIPLIGSHWNHHYLLSRSSKNWVSKSSQAATRPMVTMRKPIEKMRSKLPMMIVPVLVDHLKQQLSTMAILVFCYKRFASNKLLFIRFKTIVQTIFQTCQEKKYSICFCFTTLVFSRSHEPFPFLSHKRELTDWARFQSNKFPPQLNLNSNRTIFFQRKLPLFRLYHQKMSRVLLYPLSAIYC